jgi:hypothetical protein
MDEGLTVGIVGTVAGIIGAVAAVVAAWYSKGSATQAGLERVEQHLRTQNDRESTVIAAQATSISVAGESWHDEPQDLLLTVHTPGATIKSVDLVNKTDLVSGTIPCTEVRPGVFAAKITPDTFAKWRHSGEPGDSYGERTVVYVKAALDLRGSSATRQISTVIISGLRGRPNGNTYYNTTTGRC